MGIKKFINSVKEVLELDEFEHSGKKKSVKRLLKKLRARKKILEEISAKKTDKKPNKKEKRELKDELSIVTLQIKKGEKILNGLTSKNTKKKKDI